MLQPVSRKMGEECNEVLWKKKQRKKLRVKSKKLGRINKGAFFVRLAWYGTEEGINFWNTFTTHKIVQIPFKFHSLPSLCRNYVKIEATATEIRM